MKVTKMHLKVQRKRISSPKTTLKQMDSLQYTALLASLKASPANGRKLTLTCDGLRLTEKLQIFGVGFAFNSISQYSSKKSPTLTLKL